MYKLFFILFILLFSTNLFSYEIINPSEAPKTETNEIKSSETSLNPEDNETKSLVWNRFVNKNFVILSIDEKQGSWLNRNIDSINNWCVNRWGFDKVEFSKECRIFCVPNKTLLKKLFDLNESKVEIRKEDGDIVISALWLILENPIPASVAPYLTRASFSELEKQENIKFSWWFLRSAEILNSPVKNIRKKLYGIVNFDKQKLSSKKIFDTKMEDYQGFSQEEKELFDQHCLSLCLMLRKELGEIKLHGLLRLQEKNKIEDVLNFVYGYKNIQEFDSKFLLFCEDVSKAVALEKIPDSYFQITNRGE